MPIVRAALVVALGAGVCLTDALRGAPSVSNVSERLPAWPTAERDGFTFEDAVWRFREHMQAILGLPGHDPELANHTLGQVLGAFEVSQGIELPEGWRRGIA